MDQQSLRERRKFTATSTMPEAFVPPSLPPQTFIICLIQYLLAHSWSITFFIVALVGVVQIELFPILLFHPLRNAFFVFCGVAASAATVAFGAYIELYRSVYLREKVSYKNARTATHGMLVSISLAGIRYDTCAWRKLTSEFIVTAFVLDYGLCGNGKQFRICLWHFGASSFKSLSCSRSFCSGLSLA